MNARKVNCYLCGTIIEANEKHERLERGSLVLWAHASCLVKQSAPEPRSDRV